MLRLASDPQFFARCFRELKLYGDHVGWACLKWLTVSVFKIRNLPLVARSDQKCKKEDLKSMSRLNSRIFIIYYIKIGAKSVQYTLSHCSLIACADRILNFQSSLTLSRNPGDQDRYMKSWKNPEKSRIGSLLPMVILTYKKDV